MSVEEEEKRIASVFDIGEEEELPHVSEETLRVYERFLREKLSFPFEGISEDDEFDEGRKGNIKVTDMIELDESAGREFYGLFCKGKRGRRAVVLPLALLRVPEDDPNRQIVRDYNAWFWNYR